MKKPPNRNSKTLSKIAFGTSCLVILGMIIFGMNNVTRAGQPEKAGQMNIVETAVSAGQFKTLVTAIQAGDLAATLQGKGPFTVFAPTDEAFAKLPDGTIEALLKDKEKLVAILTYHVVPGKVTAKDVIGMNAAKTVNGKSFKISQTGDAVMVDNAKVVKTDISASNGIIHVIDTVLIPSE